MCCRYACIPHLCLFSMHGVCCHPPHNPCCVHAICLQDFESISRIGDSKKREQAGKTGRFG